jgi:hypothetical protein
MAGDRTKEKSAEGRGASDLPPAPPENRREGNDGAGPVEETRCSARPLNHIRLEPHRKRNECSNQECPPVPSQGRCESRASQTEKPR